MSRYAPFILSLFFGIAFQVSHGIEVNIKDKDGKLCLYANLTVNFSVSYEVPSNMNITTKFGLPEKATTAGSQCNAKNSTLKLNFGEGNSWSVNFSMNGTIYQADSITFFYNLSDSAYFPRSLSNETVSVTVNPQITNVVLDTCYSCRNNDMIQAESVNMTLWNVLMQAFVSNGSKSENITSCRADQPTTTSSPTTHFTSTTTATPTTTPTPTLPTPTTGKYQVGSKNSTACLLASFALRLGFKQGKKYQEMNLDPSEINASGSCGVNSSKLVLTSNTTRIEFVFTSDSQKFHLHALNFTTNSGFSEGNTNLSLWEASLGSSYMCNKEQNYTITDLLSLYTFNLQVQPFGVKNSAFSTAEECFLDSDLSFLVPIAVGVALGFLIILVLISYLIGRRKSRTGYQSV
uniref:lysosome-associated membrane glycoprotein 2 isoform X1 n=1 Tax=Monopterus albus TaxID=43700 RepID=UPI0009B47CC9|nr:lysosome-associated membrane glycoprotein 2 isoform X1 [Monopterus albus]